MTVADPHDLCRSLLAEAGVGEDVEVCAGRRVRTEVRVHGGEVESVTVAESFGVGVRVVADGREGHAHAGSFDRDVVSTLVADARDNALFAEPDPRVGLAVPDGVEPVDLDPWDDRVAELPIDAKIDLAVALEAATLAADLRVRGVRTAVYGDSRVEQAIVSTTGVEAVDRGTSSSLSVSALVDDLDGGTRTGGAVASGLGPDDLDAEEVAGRAVRRALELLGARPPSSTRLPVVLEPRFTATVLGVVASMLSGEQVFKQRSPFVDRVGDVVADRRVRLSEDPTDPRSLGASPFDGEGLATRCVPLVDDGRLTGLLHDSRSARGAGTRSTASAVRSLRGAPTPGHRALHLAGGDGDLDSVVAAIDDGVLVCSLQGLHSGINPVSGDFSVGLEGIRIRNGERAEPIREATLAGTVPRMLLDVVAVGADVEVLPGGAVVPTTVVDGLSLGGAG